MKPRTVPPGPGITKVRRPIPLSVRTLQLVRCADPLWSLWFDRLDVVSEGLAQMDGSGLMYRGSSSVIVLTDQHGGLLPAHSLVQATQVAQKDPHFWLRAMRIARKEAVCRSPGPLDSIQVELTVREDPRGVRADIDVCGRVLAQPVVVKQKR